MYSYYTVYVYNKVILQIHYVQNKLTISFGNDAIIVISMSEEGRKKEET